jgi:hypothetical protein
MTSRFNTLFRGSAEDAANELENNDSGTTQDEQRLALINALRRIEALERREANRSLPKPVNIAGADLRSERDIADDDIAAERAAATPATEQPPSLVEALEELLSTCELCVDDLEPETVKSIDRAYAALKAHAPTPAA